MSAEGLRSNVVLLVVGTMCALAVGYAISTVLLVGFGKHVPNELWMAASGAVGYVAGLLTNTRHEQAQDVQVVNEPTDPVPVEGDGGFVQADLVSVVCVVLLVLVFLKVYGLIH